MTELEKFRYSFEHQILPKMLYESKTNMLNAVLDKQGKFFSDLYLIYGPGTDIVYKEEDFKVLSKRCMFDKKMLYFIIVEMPKPTVPSLCKRVYFCYEVESDIVRYYTSELNERGSLFMCSWNKNLEHSNYGESPIDEELEFRKIGNMFLKYIMNCN